MLIALALVILCAVPLLTRPIRIYRDELRVFEEAEKERLCDWTFSQVKELLLRNEIPWGKLPGLNGETEPFFLQPAMIYIPGKEPRQVERSFTLFGKGEKEGRNGEIYRMLYVKIAFQPKLCKNLRSDRACIYRVIVQNDREDKSLTLQ